MVAATPDATCRGMNVSPSCMAVPRKINDVAKTAKSCKQQDVPHHCGTLDAACQHKFATLTVMLMSTCRLIVILVFPLLHVSPGKINNVV